MEAASKEEKAPAGWYERDGGLQFWDGKDWTLHRVPKPPSVLTKGNIAEAVFFGVFAALAAVWILAQIAPDIFYFPVKFVVEDLP